MWFWLLIIPLHEWKSYRGSDPTIMYLKTSWAGTANGARVRLLCLLHTSKLGICFFFPKATHRLQWKWVSNSTPRKSIGRPGLEPVPLTEAKTFPAFLDSFAPLLLTVLALVLSATKLGSKEVCRREFEVAGTNAVKRTFEGDEVTPAAVCVADTVVRVIAACMFDNEAAILPTHLFLDTTTRSSAPFVLSPTKRKIKSETTRSNHTSIPTFLPTTSSWPIHFT